MRTDETAKMEDSRPPPAPSSYLASGASGVVDSVTRQRLILATRPMRRGELIAILGGTVIDRHTLAALGPGATRHTLQVDEDLFLYSTQDGPGDWLNHSCNPNAGLRGQIAIVAMRRIAPGEEICFDYAMADGCGYDEFDCHCGSGLCRGRVTGSDWRRPDLWQRYEGFFSPYLEARIARLRRRQRLVRPPEQQHLPLRPARAGRM